jgi:uncharacterized RDD family membrane protein YckC
MIRFRRKVLTLALGFFAAMVLLTLPMAALVDPVFPTSRRDPYSDTWLERSAFWKGGIWYIARSSEVHPFKDSPYVLKTVDLQRGAAIRTAAEGVAPDAWILPDRHFLWLISRSGVQLYAHGKIQPLTEAAVKRALRPFLYKGLPTVIHNAGGGWAMSVLENGAWRQRRTIGLPVRGSGSKIDRNLQPVVIGDQIVLFLLHRSKLYVCVLARADEPGRSFEDWAPVEWANLIPQPWRALSSSDAPAIFYSQSASRTGIASMRWTNYGWEKFIELDTPNFRNMNVLRADSADRFIALVQSSAGAFQLIEFNQTGVIRTIDQSEKVDISNLWLPVLLLPLFPMLIMPPALAVVLSRMMPRYRVTMHSADMTRMRYASLIRRGGAQCIDLILVGAPFVAIAARSVRSLFAGFDPRIVPVAESGFGTSVGLLLYLLLCFFLYSLLEGRWGGSPGKWIMGIRVLGTDLQPCGFKRAMQRNLLKLFDGLFNFMIGIVMVALSERWQRFGDIYARTVVVETGLTFS